MESLKKCFRCKKERNANCFQPNIRQCIYCTEANKAYKLEHRARPGVREREVAKQKEYQSRPDVKARAAEWGRAYSGLPENKKRAAELMRERRRLPRVIEYEKTLKANYRAVAKCKKRGNKYETFDKAIIYERDGWSCVYCGKPLIKDTRDPNTMPTIDHVIPISRGGAHIIENCVTSCCSCNSKKHNKLLTELNW